MPESTWMDCSMCIKRRDGNTGIAIMSMPRERAMRYDDSDISEIWNSWNLSCRQKVSEGSEYVGTSSAPSISTWPLIRGCTRSLYPEMKLSLSLGMASPVYNLGR